MGKEDKCKTTKQEFSKYATAEEFKTLKSQFEAFKSLVGSEFGGKFKEGE